MTVPANTSLYRQNQFKFPHSFHELVQTASRSTKRLALGAAILAWLPLLALCALHGWVAFRSFLFDVAAQSRLLFIVPLLILTEPVLVELLSAIARHFLVSEVVRKEDQPRFEKLFASFKGRGSSLIAQLIIMVVIYALVASAMGYVHRSALPAWCYILDAPGKLSGAGTWYILVSLPLTFFLLFRWIWRQMLWSRFLHAVSRMDLRLLASHPDLTGGLSFLETSLRGYLPFGLAIGTIVAGGVANEIIHHQVPLLAFKYVPLIIVAVVLLICLGPFCTFLSILVRTRRSGVFEYGCLALGLGHQFEKKWLYQSHESDAEILEAPDFSAAIDLYSVVANVRQMKVFPLGLQSITSLVVATLVPAIPLALVVVPFDVLMQNVLKLLL
jgi:hypothetical protein